MIEDYRLGRSTRGSKTIDYLILSEEGFRKVESLFDKDGRGIRDGFTMNLRSKHNIYCWKLHITKRGDTEFPYSVYGTSGDSTFGPSPWFYYSQYSGNLKVSGEIFGEFIRKVF